MPSCCRMGRSLNRKTKSQKSEFFRSAAVVLAIAVVPCFVMFLRVVRANVSKGVKRQYVRVVEAYRDRSLGLGLRFYAY
jgi:hypothetical protein